MPSIRGGDYYTMAGAAERLEVDPSTVWRWIKAGILPAHRVGPRAIRINKEDLDKVIRPANGQEVAMADEQLLFQAPTAQELARRQTLVAQILAKRKERVIAPLTTSDLVHKIRAEEERAYGRPR